MLPPGRIPLPCLPANQIASPQESSWQLWLLLLLLQLQQTLLPHPLHCRGTLRAPKQAARGRSRRACRPLRSPLLRLESRGLPRGTLRVPAGPSLLVMAWPQLTLQPGL